MKGPAKLPLKGQVSSDRYNPRTRNEKIANPGHAIFPIILQNPDHSFSAIGTGFYVTPSGIFFTAAHVVRAALDSSGNDIGTFGLVHLHQGDTYNLRPILRTSRNDATDLAVGIAAPMENREGKALVNNFLAFSRKRPEVGTSVFTYAYPKTDVEHGEVQTISLKPGYYAGSVAEHFPNGRDSVLLPGPCYRTSMVLHGGASGGPVLAGEGLVVGVNSTGLGDDEVSYVSCISAALDLELTDLLIPGESEARSATVGELVDLGLITSR